MFSIIYSINRLFLLQNHRIIIHLYLQRTGWNLLGWLCISVPFGSFDPVSLLGWYASFTALAVDQIVVIHLFGHGWLLEECGVSLASGCKGLEFGAWEDFSRLKHSDLGRQSTVSIAGDHWRSSLASVLGCVFIFVFLDDSRNHGVLTLGDSLLNILLQLLLHQICQLFSLASLIVQGLDVLIRRWGTDRIGGTRFVITFLITAFHNRDPPRLLDRCRRQHGRSISIVVDARGSDPRGRASLPPRRQSTLGIYHASRRRLSERALLCVSDRRGQKRPVVACSHRRFTVEFRLAFHVAWLEHRRDEEILPEFQLLMLDVSIIIVCFALIPRSNIIIWRFPS